VGARAPTGVRGGRGGGRDGEEKCNEGSERVHRLRDGSSQTNVRAPCDATGRAAAAAPPAHPLPAWLSNQRFNIEGPGVCV